jgi:Uma2 family endonuclease
MILLDTNILTRSSVPAHPQSADAANSVTQLLLRGEQLCLVLALRKLYKTLSPLLPAGYFLQTQEPITLDDGEPEPDAAVIKGTDEDFASRIKLRSYASASIPVYWIVDLVGRAIEVYQVSQSASAPPGYAERKRFAEDETIPVSLFGTTIGEIEVKNILPDLIQTAATAFDPQRSIRLSHPQTV